VYPKRRQRARKGYENKTGQRNDGSDYSFWSQFVTVEGVDRDDGKIGAWISADGKFNLKKGDRIKITNGKLDSYIKDDKTFFTINGKLGELKENPIDFGSPPQSADNGQREMRIIRGNSLNATMSATQIPLDMVKDYLAAGVQWIMAGTWELNPLHKPAKRIQTEPDAPEPDDDIPF